MKFLVLIPGYCANFSVRELFSEDLAIGLKILSGSPPLSLKYPTNDTRKKKKSIPSPLIRQ